VRSDGLFLQMLGRGMRGPENAGTERCLLVTTGERLPDRFDQEGNLDVERHEWVWTVGPSAVPVGRREPSRSSRGHPADAAVHRRSQPCG